MCTDDDAIRHLEKELGMTLTVDALIDPPNSVIIYFNILV